MRRASPSAIAPSASRMTTGAAQLPPIHPSKWPSAVITAFAPGLAEVGRSARTTVAVATRSCALRAAHRPAVADTPEEGRDRGEAVERVRREVVVGVGDEGPRAAGVGRIAARP